MESFGILTAVSVSVVGAAYIAWQGVRLTRYLKTRRIMRNESRGRLPDDGDSPLRRKDGAGF